MRRKTTYALLVLLTLLGFALRLYRLDAVPLRGDEAFSAVNWSGLPVAQSLATIATIEPHPPLTYVLFRAWGISVGTDHELTLRLLPALGNLLGIPALYALGVRLYGRTGGILAAALWALHPFQVWHAQDFRNYALWAGMSATALALAWRIISGQRTRRDWLLYTAAATATGFTFYFELLTIGTVALFVLLMHRRERAFVLRWCVLNGIIAGAVLVTFGLLQGMLVGSGSYAGTGDRVNFGQLVTRFLPALVLGETFSTSGAANAAAGAALLLIGSACVWGLWRSQRHQALFLLLLAVLPGLLLALVSVRLGLFNPRYVLLSAPAITLLLVGGSVLLLRRPQRLHQMLAWAAVAAWAAASLYSLHQHYHNPALRKSPGWKALAAYLSQNVQPDDLVIQTAVDAAFGYYYDYYRVPALDIALPSSFDQPADEIVRILEERTAQHRRVWIVATTFTAWANHGVVEAWADTHMQRTRYTVTEGLPVRQYMPWQIAPDEIASAGAEAPVFGQAAALVSAHAWMPPEPTGELTLWLYWEGLQTTRTPYKVFVHLVGETKPATGSPLWAQSDSFPQRGRVGTDSWQQGEVYRDVHVLNIRDLPAGMYSLWVGFYDPDTGQRLLTAEGEDSIMLRELTLP